MRRKAWTLVLPRRAFFAAGTQKYGRLPIRSAIHPVSSGFYLPHYIEPEQALGKDDRIKIVDAGNRHSFDPWLLGVFPEMVNLSAERQALPQSASPTPATGRLSRAC
jgi:hypothetical protein